MPKHAQLRTILLEQIDGGLSPGDLIASERDLMATHGVSRATVRSAIGSLVGDGRLQRVHGKGTVVTRPRVESQLHLASFTQDMRRRGHRPTTQVLQVGALVPPADVAAALRLAEDATAWRVERLRLADDEPMAHEVSWYPVDRFPGLDAEDLTGSLYSVLSARYGVTVDGATQTAWSELCGRALATLLDVRRPASVLVFERVGTAGGDVVEHTTSAYRGDRYQIQMSLGPSTAPSPHPTEEGRS
ncbi:GntR family transcriptional regulator [Solicola sp. PLA-1-18]|uniref:GntR family transcriptional regulator n=1 Tax=Solicola sp. PLA-1-18 TaxID=3380532 RepID=UPI003B7AB8E2